MSKTCASRSIGHGARRPKIVLAGLILSCLAAGAAVAQVPDFDWKLIYDFNGTAVYFRRSSVHEQAGFVVATLRAPERGSNTLSTAPDLFAATDCQQKLTIANAPFATTLPPLDPVTDPKQRLIIRFLCAR